MKLQIKNKCIQSDIYDILRLLKEESKTSLLRDIIPSAKDIKVTCPYHSCGQERHPSCYIHRDESSDTELGTGHCFACGKVFSLVELVNLCFDEDDDSFGEEWLLNRCETAFVSQLQYLPPIELEKKREEQQFLDEGVLKNFEYYHDYMWYRKLSREVVDLFEVGYDPKKEMITFPVRDERGRLVFITGRSVKTKRFEIPEEVQKPIYLLYYIKQHNIKSVAVCESQLDALTSWTYGQPAVATMGCPSDKQIELLNKSGVTVVISMFDNDEAGCRFTRKLKKGLRDDIFLLYAKFPEAVKDVNDLTKEQFDHVIANLT